MSKKSETELQHIAKLRGKEMPLAAIVKNTKKMLNNLTGSYLTCIDKTFSFLHDTMYKTVAKLHANEYPDEIIKHCTVDYFCQCIFDDHIFIDKDDYRSLAERCVKEVIETEDGQRLSKHPMFQSKAFVCKFVETVTENKEMFEQFFTK